MFNKKSQKVHQKVSNNRWGRSGITTIQLNKAVVRALKRIKEYPRETYNEVILNLIKNAEETKELDIFIQKGEQFVATYRALIEETKELGTFIQKGEQFVVTYRALIEETKELGTFIQKAQREKMKELWEEGDYTAWENV